MEEAEEEGNDGGEENSRRDFGRDERSGQIKKKWKKGKNRRVKKNKNQLLKNQKHEKTQSSKQGGGGGENENQKR